MLPHDTDPYLDIFRMSENQLLAIVAQLNRYRASHRGDSRRKSERLDYHQVGKLEVQMEQPGGNIGRYLVFPRDLSETGLGFLHAMFTYPGTRCEFRLRTADGQCAVITGEAVRCRHVRGRVHDVGMRFDEPIDLTTFVFDHADQRKSA